MVLSTMIKELTKTWGWAKINIEHSCIYICFWLFENKKYKTADGIFCTTFILVCELEWIKCIFNVIIQFSDHNSFKTIHDSWSVIIFSFIFFSRANQSTIPLFFELCTAPSLLLLVENFLQLQKQLMLVWTQLIQLFFQLWYLQIKTKWFRHVLFEQKQRHNRRHNARHIQPLTTLHCTWLSVLCLECSKIPPKDSGHNIDIYTEANMELFA